MEARDDPTVFSIPAFRQAIHTMNPLALASCLQLPMIPSLSQSSNIVGDVIDRTPVSIIADDGTDWSSIYNHWFDAMCAAQQVLCGDVGGVVVVVVCLLFTSFHAI
jgi:hypothetical protein